MLLCYFFQLIQIYVLQKKLCNLGIAHLLLHLLLDIYFTFALRYLFIVTLALRCLITCIVNLKANVLLC